MSADEAEIPQELTDAAEEAVRQLPHQKPDDAQMRAMDAGLRPHKPPEGVGFPAWLWLSDHGARWHAERASLLLVEAERRRENDDVDFILSTPGISDMVEMAAAHAATASAITGLAMTRAMSENRVLMPDEEEGGAQ